MQKIITYNLSENFIQRLADFIEKEYVRQGKDITRLGIVFGGKRPSLFLAQELARRIKKGFFSPRFFSIDEFVDYTLSQKESYTVLSDLDACYMIYSLAKELAPDMLRERSSFSQFLPWAREILAFIEQLDLEDIQVLDLKNIEFKARIGYDVPESINALLESIIALRNAFQALALQKHLYTRGLMYLRGARSIAQNEAAELDQILFCGFFYLHKTEEEIIAHLFKRGKATLFFQGDEAQWSILEKLSQKFSSSLTPQEPHTPDFSVHLYAGFDVHSEVALVREIVKSIPRKDDTVIVLPGPEQVIPLLSEIASEVDTFNVSMGYPLKRSSLYSLFAAIARAQETKKQDAYYAKDYLKVLTHPLIKNLSLGLGPGVTRVLVHKIEEILVGIEKTPLGGSLFIRVSEINNSRDLFDLALLTLKAMEIEVSRDELKQAAAELHRLLFVDWEQMRNFLDFSGALQQLLDTLVGKGFLGNYPLNVKMAEKLFSVAQELHNASFRQEPFSKEDMFKIFDNKIRNEMISFSGSPLRGMQILGLFETRSLHFENVIIMDANEAVLPHLKIYEPLIPRDVMISLGINRLEKEEEIQRYQFKRLLAGAKNVHLVYQERDDKERSRFVEELVWEKQKEMRSLNVMPPAKAGFKVRVLPKRLEIMKNAHTLAFLEKREYSASSINMYLECPLQFYYQYVLGLREKEDLLDEPEGADIGTFIHELLAETFSPFVGRAPRIDKKFKQEFFEVLDKKFSEDFERKMKSDSFLIKEILRVRMERFLENENKRDIKEIISLEKTFQARIPLAGREFRFKAIIDRIDTLHDDSFLIIDYKTGSTEMMPSEAEKIESRGFTREALKSSLKSFQLPLYLYCVENDAKFKGQKINACLYSLKNIDKDFGLNKLYKSEEQLSRRNESMKVYLAGLEAILTEILDHSVPFKADEGNAHICHYCPFFYLCR